MKRPYGKPPFRLGIDTLVDQHAEWFRGCRVALLSHPAAVNAAGAHTSAVLHALHDVRLTTLLGPEHGFFGEGAAGQRLGHTRHPQWKLPVYSLYGQQRRPTPAMLKGVDVLVVDLQDLGARPYTFVTSLRYVLEAAADRGIRVIVADRPIPLPRIVDGPMLDPRFESFVGGVPAPMAYGMTPGEAALWLQEALGLDVDLKVAAMTGYRRDRRRDPSWAPWIPPSPGIKSWESAQCYLATLLSEGIPQIDIGRDTGLAFQVLGAPWMNGQALADRLGDEHLAGVQFHSHVFQGQRDKAPRLISGIRLVVTNADRFRPVRTAISLLFCLQQLYGKDRLWKTRGVRPEFFDKLFGTDTVRRRLLDGETPSAIVDGWTRDSRRFVRARRRVQLYPVGVTK